MIEAHQKNWAGNITYQATERHFPTTTEQAQQLVRDSKMVKAVGSRHSFNTVADCSDTHISLQQMKDVVKLDTDNNTVTVQGGITYGELSIYLHANGYALHNLASLPHISVVGAVMTGTHGSGEANGNLSTAVSALEFVNGTGDVVQVSRADTEHFDGMVVSLGALGIVTQITLDIQPTYDVRQDVYLNMPFEQVYANFDAIQSSAYSVSLFTRWEDDTVSQVWVKSKADTDFTLGDGFYGASRSPMQVSPVGEDLIGNTTEQLGAIGAWHDRLPHFRMEFTPSHGDEIQAEYFVPREQAIPAMQAINSLHAEITPLLHVTEIRTMTGDTLWLSPAYGRDSVAFHFTWKPMWEELQPVLTKIQSVLAPYAVRPHWGKVYSISAEDVIAQYPRFEDFQQLVAEHDPHGKFRNPFLMNYLG